MSTRSVDLTPETPVRMPLSRFWAIIISIVVTVCGGTVYGTSLLRDIRDELKELNTAVSQSWTVSDQERWVNRLEKGNRSLQLFVPEVHEVRPARSEK